ncbi:AAA domain-containing protein [Aquabacterium sp.]|uniref:AAA domain-containing protein n=1 Tax=Aquabacterium sp. TaxID=1872578 RepID=UPI0024888C6A|nr:AAA domain-containing protein [Aquabacterium sp.]MDI1258262.1 AAA domain-containing protein [Aquabacterium sp.]
MSEHSASILDLLTYIEEAEKLKRKPVYVVPTEFFASHQVDLKGLPDLQVNLQEPDGDVWLRVPRLQELKAPSLPEQLVGWVTLSQSLTKPPVLLSSLPVMNGKTQVGEELLTDQPELPELFDWYLKFHWEPWQLVETIRRKTISLYNKLFVLNQTLSMDGVENPIELVWGVGMASWKKAGSPSKVEHPLLTQACEIRLNSRTFALEISPREADSKIELDCYAEMELPGVMPLEALWKETQSKLATPLSPFSPDTYEPILKAAVANLDPSGRYEGRTDDLSVPTARDVLCLTNTWVIFARKRSADVFLEDVRRLKKKVEDGAQVPAVIEEFVRPGDAQVRTRQEVAFRGLSTSASGAGVRELYFPMPYNEEQVSIIRKLESNNGVVVQGPPGTGKTHTIANVICHYLAQGKRVLVTSKGETALAVLQNKLPERIRPLSVALLSDEKEGMRQFEHSIGKIASEVSALQPMRLQANIATLEQQLGELHARISAVDQAISKDASRNMQKYVYQGQEVTPEDLAKLVMSRMDDFQWFDDELPEHGSQTPPLTDDDIALLRKARIHALADLGYIGTALPLAADLPTWEPLSALHKDIVRAKTIEEQVAKGVVHALKDSSFETFEQANQLLTHLTHYLEQLSKVKARGFGLLTRFRDAEQGDTLVLSLMALQHKVAKLEDLRKQLVAQAVDVPPGAEQHVDFLVALDRLLEGKSAFGLPFGKAEARKLVAAVSVAGSEPTREAWAQVKEAVQWRLDSRRELARFGAIATEFGLEIEASVGLDTGIKRAHDQLIFVGHTHELVYAVERQLFGRVEAVFGTRMANDLGDDYEISLAGLVDSLLAQLDKGRLGYAMGKVSEYLAVLDGKSGDITGQLKAFLQNRIGNPDLDESVLRQEWVSTIDELKRLNALKPQFDVIEECCVALTKSGATQWAQRLLMQPPTVDFDPLLPLNWRDAWAWRLALSLLERIDVHSRLRARFEERRTLTSTLAKTYQDLVAEKTWLGVYNNSPSSIRQALQSYLTSIQSMGSGTGIRAVRHRRNAREAMKQAYLAVPCWVLPQWRVSETLPPEMGLFDLVVIDEASQSDIWALPALLRGKKLLVVGDHKQVSPSVVGIPEQKILDIQRRFLDAQPHGKHMTPDSSIYDLARVIFAGNSVMLKEHFRCVSAIIEYSKREFYEHEIVPLRVPKASERLDPPLVDVFVKGGYRKGDANPPEAQAIVNEILAIIADDRLGGRSLGVVTLLGTEQAKLIHDLIADKVPAEEVVAREITVGPPPLFQGRERDIMLVSMVLQPGDKTAANTLGQQQRFNVALSRARDRTYLFRSVGDDAFPPDSLSGRLLRHFRLPFAQDSQGVKASRELCESGFELEMFDELTKRGFRVRPQVPCGGFRIDFVVEGREGRRLAIECDGDRFHGPGQWSEDMARQRVLERAGWVFWRCFASSFVRRRKEVMEDLRTNLGLLGIEPMEDEEQDTSHWVTKKEVDPMDIANSKQFEGENT